MTLAPVILFVYNRPEHTRQTLTALAANVLANNTVLYIFQDGLNPNADAQMRSTYNEVAKLVDEFEWPGQKVYTQGTENKGLAKSIIGGVTQITQKHGKAIVLEDDLVSGKDFLQYMNDALHTYESNKAVMHISGYLFPVHVKLPETFFHTTTNSWGWATWADRWSSFNINAQELFNELNKQGRTDAFNLDGYGNSLQQLKDNIDGRINTWAVKWEASVFLKRGYCLYPGQSLIRNIGHDNSGVHCSIHNYELYTFQPIADSVNVKEQPLRYNEAYRNAMKYFVRLNGDVSLFSRLRFDLNRAVYKIKKGFK